MSRLVQSAFDASLCRKKPVLEEMKILFGKGAPTELASKCRRDGLDADFARFLTIARASLMETHASARTGRNRCYFTDEETERLQRLTRRAGKASTALIRYLQSCKEPQNPKR